MESTRAERTYNNSYSQQNRDAVRSLNEADHESRELDESQHTRPSPLSENRPKNIAELTAPNTKSLLDLMEKYRQHRQENSEKKEKNDFPLLSKDIEGELGVPPKDEHIYLNFEMNSRNLPDVHKTLPKEGNKPGDSYTYHFSDANQTTIRYKWNTDSGGTWTETVSDISSKSGGSRTIRVNQIKGSLGIGDLAIQYEENALLPFKQPSLEPTIKEIVPLTILQPTAKEEIPDRLRKKTFDAAARAQFDRMFSGASLMIKDPSRSSEYRHLINLDPSDVNYRTIFEKLNDFDIQEVEVYIDLPYGSIGGSIPFYNVGIDLLFEQEQRKIKKDMSTIKTDFKVTVIVNRFRGASLKAGYKIVSK